jgi:hypothetical protein
MDVSETLGVLAHPGGMLVERPELTVGLLRATAGPAALEIELVARRPPDRRTALERQADIRAGRDGVTAAERRLLPDNDEGMELRFAQLDDDGRARWAYPIQSASSSGWSDGRAGPSLRALYQLPPVFGAGSFVLAWPEIGFPETVIRLALPDRATVDRGTVGIWQAPAPPTSAPAPGLRHRDDAPELPDVEVERGRSVAAPQLLRRNENAVVVLTRLTAVATILSMEVRCAARGAVAGDIIARSFPPGSAGGTSPRHRPAAAVAVLNGAEARWLHQQEGTAGGGPDGFEETGEYHLERPAGDTLDLIVGWPAAGLPEARLTIALTPLPRVPS